MSEPSDQKTENPGCGCATQPKETVAVGSTLTWRDRFRHFGYRWGFGRMRATVRPGLYALNAPDRDSPVLVSANYRLSFDVLRSALPAHSAWILVADTRGINVWCAAGKGTFSAQAVAAQVDATKLGGCVAHRRLILPQLSAPGVAAHHVRELTGFQAVFGPVRASDLPAYLATGQCTPAMRRVTFPFYDRLVLVPMEFMQAFWPLAIAAAVIGCLGGWAAGLAFLAAGASASIAVPLLHNVLPGRWLSVKGVIWGALASAGLAWALCPDWPRAVPLLLAGMAVSAFAALNFTGATTYTSVHGVKKEMRWMLPVIIAFAAVALGWWVVYFVIGLKR